MCAEVERVDHATLEVHATLYIANRSTTTWEEVTSFGDAASRPDLVGVVRAGLALPWKQRDRDTHGAGPIDPHDVTGDPGSLPDSLRDAALEDTAKVFPGSSARLLWFDISGTRAVVVAEVGLDQGPYLHQVACLHEAGAWQAWTSGPAPGWLELDVPFVVVTRCDPVQADTTAVRLEHSDMVRVVDIEGLLFFQAGWDIGSGDELRWPRPTAVSRNGRWEPTVPLDLPVTADYFIERYLAFEMSHEPEDEWAWDALTRAAAEQPEQACLLILRAIEQAQSDELLYVVAAGPLEDLLAQHTALAVQRLEEITDSPKLKRALQGVWVDVADAELAARLQRVSQASARPGRRVETRQRDRDASRRTDWTNETRS